MIKLIRLPLALTTMMLGMQPYDLHAEKISKDTPSVWTLSIKPRICIMPQNQQLCEMESDILWSGQTKADICLLSSMQSDNVQCWSNALQGHLIEKIVINKQISYWLSPTGSNKVLVESQILIVTIPDKNTKRRRRHIWSLL